jgi:hypothetical protein
MVNALHLDIVLVIQDMEVVTVKNLLVIVIMVIVMLLIIVHATLVGRVLCAIFLYVLLV